MIERERANEGGGGGGGGYSDRLEAHHRKIQMMKSERKALTSKPMRDKNKLAKIGCR